jgi:hypothetical protein
VPVYDAFISYSHAKDKPIAVALQSVIQKLGEAWYQRRAARVFRDDTSLSATPHLMAFDRKGALAIWPSDSACLARGRYFALDRQRGGLLARA